MESYLDNGTLYESHDYNRQQREYEKGGLIPITANIINKAQITQEETVEFQGIQLNDISIVGFVMDFKEIENKTKILLYDYTGSVEISFFNKNDCQDNLDLKKNFTLRKIPIHVYGTVKVYKNEKCLQGAKLLEANCSSVLYHRADVIYSWFYLTGKLQDMKNNAKSEKNNNVVKENNNNSINVNYTKINEDDPIKMLENYEKSSGNREIEENKLLDLFKKFGAKRNEIINYLVNNNKLIENNGKYEIM